MSSWIPLDKALTLLVLVVCCLLIGYIAGSEQCPQIDLRPASNQGDYEPIPPIIFHCLNLTDNTTYEQEESCFPK